MYIIEEKKKYEEEAQEYEEAQEFEVYKPPRKRMSSGGAVRRKQISRHQTSDDTKPNQVDNKEETDIVKDAEIKKVKKESTTMSMYYLALVKDWQGVSYLFRLLAKP